MIRIIVLACVLAAGAVVACDPPPPDCRPTGVTTRRDVRYRTTPGVPARDQSLDLYLPVRASGCAPTPLVVYVHGGGSHATTAPAASTQATTMTLITPGASRAFVRNV